MLFSGGMLAKELHDMPIINLLKMESTNEEKECFANYFFAARAFTNLIKKPH